MRTPLHTTGTKTAIGYVRVSTQEQATEGVSLDAQRDRIRAYCRLHGFKLIQIAELLRGAQPRDRETAARGASELRAQGMQLREIGVRLALDGFFPRAGRLWPPARVHELLASEELADRGG